MKKFGKLSLAAIVLFFLGSCQEDYQAEKSAVQAMSGEYWVELFYDGDQDGLVTEADKIFAYADYGAPGIVIANTSANTTDSILIDDPEHAWPFRMKAPVDFSNFTIKPSTNLNIEATYLGSGETVTVISGKVLPGAATSLSGAKADSIFLELEFSDDPGSYYVFSGHRYSGQTEDDY